MKRFYPMFLALGLILSACSPQIQSQPGLATSPGTSAYPGPTSTSTRSATSYPGPAATPTLSGTVSPQPPTTSAPPTKTPGPTTTIHYVNPGIPVDPVCVVPINVQQLNQAPFEQYPQSILDYLNSGATISQLDQALYDLGIGSLPISNAEADLTGDGKFDRVVSIFSPVSVSIPPTGRVMVYICDTDRYVLSYELVSQPSEGAPGIRFLQDLNGDRAAELILSIPACGASTCFEAVHILAWDGNQFTNRLEGTSDDLPYPSIAVTDDDGDQVFSVEVTASGNGSIGAGPQRTILRVWNFRPPSESWVPGPDIPGASNYRIHILHDADSLAVQGDLENAIRLYQRVASDATLLDWKDPVAEQATLGAYARYRLIVLYMQMGQPTFADSVLSEMDMLYPLASLQRPYVNMARIFLTSFRSDGITGGCQAAREYAEEHENETLLPLGQQGFGTGNKDYRATDVCEW